MKASCPNNSKHATFVTVAYVSEDWLVDSDGTFLDVADGSCGEVLHKPDPDNTWTCTTCGAEAKVER